MTGTPTLSQISETMRTDLDGVRDAQDALEAAQRTYATLTDRTRHSSDEAHEVALRDYLPPLREAEEHAARVAAAAERNARGILKAIGHDRIWIDPNESTVAAQREPLIRQIVETSALPALADELRAAVIGEDRPTLYVFATLIPARLAAAPAPREAGQPEIDEARGELRGMLAQVRQTLRDKSFDATRARAGEVIAKARTVSLAAATRKQRAEEAARFARGEKVAWPADPNLRAS